MERILYVNYMAQRGHVNFDTIQVDALLAAGHDVRIVAHKAIAAQMPYQAERYAKVLPGFMGAECKNALLNRLLYLAALLYIRIAVRPSRFGRVVVSNADEITLALAPLCRGMAVFCHNMANGLANPVKRFFIRKLAKHNRFLVFNAHMAEPFRAMGMHNVAVVSHGCMAPWRNVGEQGVVDTSPFRFVVFHPSPSPDTAFVEAVVADRALARFLEDESVLLVLRNAKLPGGCRNIVSIDRYLPQVEYRALFCSADAILVAYPQSFGYRVSGVSYECAANGKRALIKANPSFGYCTDFFNYDPFFEDTAGLCRKIAYLKTNKEAACTATPETLRPDHRAVIGQKP